MEGRRRLKRALSTWRSTGGGDGLTVLIYHRVGGETADERDVSLDGFAEQMELLASHRVLSLDDALDELAAGDDRPKTVLTFDDGFEDVHSAAFPTLAEHRLPFTLYLTAGCVGGAMSWEGSTATRPGPALSWAQIEDLVGSGLCTIGNHTHTHVGPDELTEVELDRCSSAIEARLGIRPAHFAYTWGVAVPAMEPALRNRFRSSASGEVGRNHPGQDVHRLRRVPV